MPFHQRTTVPGWGEGGQTFAKGAEYGGPDLPAKPNVSGGGGRELMKNPPMP